MGARFQILMDAIRSTIASPAADPSRTLLLVGIALILLLIIVLALLMLVTPKQRKVVKIRRYRVRPGEDDGYYHPDAETDEAAVASPIAEAPIAEEEPTEAPVGAEADAEVPEPTKSPAVLVATRTARLVGAWAVPLLIFAAVASSYYITGTDVYCAKTCHVNQVAVTHAGNLKHASCIACHERPGVSAVPQNVASRLSMIVGQTRGTKSHGAVVDSESCLRCHQKQMTVATTSASGIKMSHAEPYAAGVACTSCHPTTGHSIVRTYTMSPCLVCHDSKTASADCLTCHTTQPLAVVAKVSTASTSTIGSGKIPYPLVDVAPRQCGACHDQARQCDTCHGLRMPHPAEFLSGGHAANAAFEKKQLCWKCHQVNDCYQCHSQFASHPANWKLAHQAYPWSGGGCACHPKPANLSSMCYLCHSATPPHKLLH